MAFKLIQMSPLALINQRAAAEILEMNRLSARFGLTLTPFQAEALVEARSHALTSHGRIEFGRGVMAQLIEVFCDSQHLNEDNYAETLGELLEIFYHIKAETRDAFMADGLISDGDIITGMHKAFETICQGSIELLAGREGLKIARSLTHDYQPNFSEDINHEGDNPDDEANE
ncbi:MAG: DUF6323 family protein [Defluviitaleaceae bacterium]|nr:DUF6323 family protein [Defluviitaleaceae bacterium]